MSSPGAVGPFEDAARHLMQVNADQLDALVARAAGYAGQHAGRAAALAQAAAEFAWFNHTGWFSHAPMEELLVGLGSKLGTARHSGPTTGRSGRAEVVHVVTQAYPTGGSTQAMVSWTDRVAHRPHHVVLTRQATTPVPEKVTRRLDDRVRLTRLDTRPGDLLHRAARLRASALSGDLVVLHTHPYDVVPALAFADRTGLPPVVMVDHADHVFWAGIRSVDHVVHLRHSGQALAQDRRGLDPARSLVRNRPLSFSERVLDRGEAKAAWDVPRDAVLLVSAADPTKFAPVDGPHLAELVLPAVQACPELHWVVAGPAADQEPWAALGRETGGRVRAVGHLTDMAGLHQAADLFLDSFPFASLTSLLESASLGNPVITYRGHPDECGVLGADSPGVDHLMERPASPAALTEVLARLTRDAASRRAAGTALSAAVRASHSGQGWIDSVESLLDLPTLQEWTGRPPVHGDGPLDLLTRAVMATTAHHRDRDRVLGSHLGALPLPSRIAEWNALRPGVGARALVPEWVPARLRSAR